MRLVLGFMVVVCLSIASSQLRAQEPAQIQVKVFGANPSVGQILASLYDSSKSYMEEPRAELAVSVDADGGVYLDFGLHPPGDYAVVVIYDEDSDGELKTGFLGIPKEKVGFSNNAWGRFGPAKWRDAKFIVPVAEAVEIQIKGVED